LRELRHLLHLDCVDVTGQSLEKRLSDDTAFVDHEIIRPFDNPFEPVGGLVALFGTLAPGGAILKRSAADAALFEHEGRAIVFDGLEDLSARLDDPDLEVSPDDLLVLKNAGPNSPAAMPEAGYLPIPKKLATSGVRDMLRISDCRMSGTAYGSVILHVTPDAAGSGPLALIETGDRVRLSVAEKRLDLLVDENVLQQRRNSAETRSHRPRRGYDRLYADHITQADQGADFDFLIADE
jgi:dihydroxy-acid dehydratase